MVEIVEAIYEKGVFKPLRKKKFKEGKFELFIIEENTKKKNLVLELKKVLSNTKVYRADLKRLEELYNEAKMHS